MSTSGIDNEDPELKHYTVRQVAELFEVTPHTVRRWIESGALKCFIHSNVWRIRRKDLLEFARDKYGDKS